MNWRFSSRLGASLFQDPTIKAALQVYRTFKGKKIGVPGQNHPTFRLSIDASMRGTLASLNTLSPDISSSDISRCSRELLQTQTPFPPWFVFASRWLEREEEREPAADPSFMSSPVRYIDCRYIHILKNIDIDIDKGNF